jgi:hypothetical protein
MNKHILTVPALALALGLGLATTPPAHAGTPQDNLLLKRVRSEHGMKLPTRGMTMKQVEKTFGAPLRKLSARGGDTPKHPVIHRWEYPGYIVYFERNRVIHSVLNTPAGNNTHPQDAH